MRRVRVVVPAIVAMITGSMLASTPVEAVRSHTAGVRGRSIDVKFRGQRPALRHQVRAAAGGGETKGQIRAELPFLPREVGADEGGGPAGVSPPTPTAPNLAISRVRKGLIRSWEGSNHFDSRFANNGNQFSSEPPDQGLCVGNGYVMESVNSVIQVYNERGRPLIHGDPGESNLPVGLSLNEFYGYPPEFDRAALKFGPFVFDTSCYYDRATRRWFHLADDLMQKLNTGEFTGKGSIDLAVSQTSNPLGRWNVYRIKTQNDGTGGTPDHGCDLGPCFADFPHIGADAHGIYLTTNEYSFFGDSYSGAQLYALSKDDLVEGNRSPQTVYYENLAVPSLGQKAFTLRGAQSRPGSFVRLKGGIEYFISSTAGDGSETGNMTGGSDKVVVWALRNTSALDGAGDPVLEQTVVTTLPYVLPPLALQRDKGPTPLLRCINAGVSCVGDPAPFKQEGPYPLDASDTRVLGSFLQNGVVWGTLGTGIAGPGGSSYGPQNHFAPAPIDEKAGVLYFALRPSWTGGLSAEVATQGYMAVDNANITYPSIVMGTGNRGYIGMTLVGPKYHPSAAYAAVGLSHEPKVVRIAARGIGPDDGFTGTFEGDFRPRWGDYGYAVPGRGGSVWFAAEYIAQRCSYDEFVVDPTCGFTRSFFANWSTRVTHLRG